MERDGYVELKTKQSYINENCSAEFIYKIYDSGKISVSTNFVKSDKLPELPRFGVRFQMPVRFDNIEWYGRGPHENYQDRMASAFIGIYQGKVIDQFVPYIYPQENGYKTDVRWVSFKNDYGKGFVITGNDNF